MVKRFLIFWIAMALAELFAVFSYFCGIPSPADNKTFIVDQESLGRVRDNIAVMRERFDCDRDLALPYRKAFNHLASKRQVPLSCSALVDVNIDEYTNEITLTRYSIIACGSCDFGRIGDCTLEGSSLFRQRMIIKLFVETILKGVKYKSTSTDIVDTLAYLYRPLILCCACAFIPFFISVFIFLLKVLSLARKGDAVNTQL